MPPPESLNAPAEVECLTQALNRLLECPDLNLDELDDQTREASEDARQAEESFDLTK